MSKINWTKRNKDLNSIFNNASFEYLNRMGIYPQPDEDGDYDESLEEINNEWALLSVEDKLDSIMEVSGYDEKQILAKIKEGNYCFLQ